MRGTRNLAYGCLVAATLVVSPASVWGQRGATAPYNVVELPIDGHPVAINDSDTAGVITVAIDSGDAGYVSAAFARVQRSTKTVLQSGFLPEPIAMDSNTGMLVNGYSGPYDVNASGTIVGSTWEYDPSRPANDPNLTRAIVWQYSAGRYTMELLPSLSGSSYDIAFGINTNGAIVGMSNRKAVVWEAGSHEVADLNTQSIAEKGWILDNAEDINDFGLIAGRGRFNGFNIGYLLDRSLGQVWPIPLVGPAISNSGQRLNELGAVVGNAWDGTGRHYGTNPDFVRGYYWTGSGASEILAPVTTSTSIANGLNDFGKIVGSSYIATDDAFALASVPTLWQINADGAVQSIDLTKQIGSKTGWYLSTAWDVNNAGWISVFARNQSKGKYRWRAVLLVPNS